jgi:hypothetical protein
LDRYASPILSLEVKPKFLWIRTKNTRSCPARWKDALLTNASTITGAATKYLALERGCLPGDLDLFPSACNHAAVPLRASADQTVTATCPGILREVKPTPRGMATAHNRNREPTHSPDTNWHVVRTRQHKSPPETPPVFQMGQTRTHTLPKATCE